MASVGKHIRQLRTAKKLTQEELAEKLHVTRQAVSAWERGQTQPDLDTLERIAQALDTEVTALIYGPDASQDLTELKRKWKRSGIQTGVILAVIYYILFFCGVWQTFLYGLDYQLRSDDHGDYQVREEVLPGPFSLDVDLQALYQNQAHSQKDEDFLLYEDDTGCRINLFGLSWEEETHDWNLWLEAWGVSRFWLPWKASIVTGGMTDDMVSYYYTTSQTAPLSVTVNGVTTPAQWIDSGPPGRRRVTFGYRLFPGTGDPSELPTQATLTFDSLLRVSARWRG